MPPLTRRTSAARAAEERAPEAADPTAETAATKQARPSNDAVYDIVKTRFLALSEPVAEPVTDNANAAAREAAEAAAKKIEDLRAQLVAKKAETDAAARKVAVSLCQPK